jgi:uncharacterized membrane protein YkvI
VKKSIQIAGAFIGLIVGAGFASGQEILQFFTSFGWPGIIGSAIATFLFAFFGMNLTQLGCRLQTHSHKKVIYHICGKYLGLAVDIVMTFFLFGVTVVMFAGAGSIFEQQFGIPGIIGNMLLALITIIVVCLNIQRVIAAMGAITPFLVLAVIIIAIYSLFSMDATFAEMNETALSLKPAASNWVLGAFLYVSYNIAAGAAMLAVMGGSVKDEKTAGWGGIIGGVGLGVLIFLINIGMFAKIDDVSGVDMPMLQLANEVSPIFGMIFSIVLLGMIFNTAVGMLYAFTARISETDTPKFKVLVIICGIAAFGASFVGFITLVGTVYPLMGYLGFTLIAAIIVAWFRWRQRPKDHGTPLS